MEWNGMSNKNIIRCPRCLRGYYKVYKVKASSALVAIEGMYKKKWNEMEWNGMEWVLVKKVMNEWMQWNEWVIQNTLGVLCPRCLRGYVLIQKGMKWDECNESNVMSLKVKKWNGL